MPLIILALGILFLFVCIIVFKLHAFLALILTSLFVGFAMGLPAMDIIAQIQNGMGGTLGYLALIIGFGTILGKVLSEGGGAQRIAMTLIDKFGKEKIGWALALAGFIIGITLFFEVSLVVLIPVTFTVAMAAKVPLLRVGIPMLASITTTHAFLPPHPAPTAVVGIFGANLGLTMVYGIIIAIPTIIIAGPLFAKLFKNLNPEIPHHLITTKLFEESELPGFGISLFTALSPIILILMSVISGFTLPEASVVRKVVTFIGSPQIALIIGAFIAFYAFGLRGKKRSMTELMKIVQDAIASIASILFIIAGGGALKQVILFSGMADYIAKVTGDWPISPLLLAFIITAIIRIAVASATVTVLTASAIVLPMLQATGASPELMVLSVCSASLFCCPPHDGGFWMVKEFFNLSMWQTVKVGTGITTLISVLGLIGVLGLSLII